MFIRLRYFCDVNNGRKPLILSLVSSLSNFAGSIGAD